MREKKVSYNSSRIIQIIKIKQQLTLRLSVLLFPCFVLFNPARVAIQLLLYPCNCVCVSIYLILEIYVIFLSLLSKLNLNLIWQIKSSSTSFINIHISGSSNFFLLMKLNTKIKLKSVDLNILNC